jgi:hypothetical protein
VSGAGAANVPNECVPELRRTTGWCGDGGPATRALASEPSSLAVMPDGSFVFSDAYNRAVRRVRDGVIDRIAGRGAPGERGRLPALRAAISYGTDLAAASDGSLLIADGANNWVRRVSPDGGIATVAGTGARGFAGDGGPATGARLSLPSAVAALPDGGFLIADTWNRRVRRVSADGVITTVAGDGREGLTGDGGPATAATLSSPEDVDSLPDGGFLIVDGAGALRRVSAGGVITTVLATEDRIRDVAPDPGGALVALISVDGRTRVLRWGLDGATTELFHGKACPPPLVKVLPGDGGPAAAAYFAPTAIAGAPDGAVLVADYNFGRIRRVSPDGVISTVAGGGGVRGRIVGRTACGGADPTYQTWDYFGIIRARVSGRAVSLKFGTTLAADVQIVVRRGPRIVARRRLDVAADVHVVRLARLEPGRLRITLVGRHGGARLDDVASVRVR